MLCLLHLNGRRVELRLFAPLFGLDGLSKQGDHNVMKNVSRDENE